MSRSRIVNLDNFQQFTAINLLADGGRHPGPVVVPNGIKVMPVWQLSNGKIARNVLGGTVSGSFVVTAAAAETLRAAIVARAEHAAQLGFLIPGTSFLRIDMQDIRLAFQPVVSSTGVATPGTSVGTALPDENAVAVTLRTALVGPGNRGRVYLPGYASNAMAAGGVIAGGAVTAAQNWVNAVAQVMSAQGMPLSLIQPERNAYTGATGTAHPHRDAAMRPVTTITCRDNHWDSQRRRGLK